MRGTVPVLFVSRQILVRFACKYFSDQLAVQRDFEWQALCSQIQRWQRVGAMELEATFQALDPLVNLIHS